jgi:hypothetical protein
LVFATAIPQAVRDLVLQLRRQHRTYGMAKLTVILARDHGVRISESTVGRIVADLMGRGLVPRYVDATRIVRNRKFTGHARRWAYDLRPQQPGEMIQIDHMPHPHPNRPKSAAWFLILVLADSNQGFLRLAADLSRVRVVKPVSFLFDPDSCWGGKTEFLALVDWAFTVNRCFKGLGSHVR